MLTVKSIFNLIQPDRGEIDCFGNPLAGNEKEIKKRIGYSTGSIVPMPERERLETLEGYEAVKQFAVKRRTLSSVKAESVLLFDELSWSYSPNDGLSITIIPTLKPAPLPASAVTPTPIPEPAAEDEEQNDEVSVSKGTKVCKVRLYWTESSKSVETDSELRIYELLYPLRYTLIVVGAISLLLAVLLFVFLLAAAGHHHSSSEIKAGPVERIPFDLLLCMGFAGVFILIIIIGSTFNSRQVVMSYVLAATCLIGAGLLTLLCLMSTAVRLKQKTLLSGCFIWRVLRRSWKWLKRAFSAAVDLLHGFPLVWKWIPVFAVLLILDFCLTFRFHHDPDMLFFVLLLRWVFLAAAILYVVLCLRRLRNGTMAISAGEESVVIDTKYMIGDFKAQADDLMHIRDGLSRAVDERMKSERLRTELITNVSHDIKTPLTSIINYVDLLSREDLPEGNATEYVEVLKRQSARLKKLTDDLVEASKASTGNLPGGIGAA